MTYTTDEGIFKDEWDYLVHTLTNPKTAKPPRQDLDSLFEEQVNTPDEPPLDANGMPLQPTGKPTGELFSDPGTQVADDFESESKRGVIELLTGSDGQKRYKLWPERVVEETLGHIKNFMMTEPGSEENIKASTNIAASLGTGGVGIAPKGVLGAFGGDIIDMAAWNMARKMEAIRKSNIMRTFSEGGGIIKELPNGYSIGVIGGSKEVNHVLLSPQGGPVLYGKSPEDLIRRGFDTKEKVKLLDHLYGTKDLQIPDNSSVLSLIDQQWNVMVNKSKNEVLQFIPSEIAKTNTGPTAKSADYAVGKLSDPNIKALPIDVLKAWMERTTNKNK